MASDLELIAMMQDETIGGEPRQVVLSPEQVTLHLAVAGPTSRMLAYAIDFVVVLAVEAVAMVFIFMATPLLGRLEAMFRQLANEVAKGDTAGLASNHTLVVMLALFLVLQLVIEWGYFIGSEMVTGGRSLGKGLMGLRVVRDGGLPITLRESVVRNLLRMVDILPSSYVVGLIAIVMSSEGKRLGDLAAGTIVVRLDRPEKAAPLPEADGVEGGPRFRFDHAQIDRLATPERALLRQTLRRLDALPPPKRAEVLGRTTEVLRHRIGYDAVETGEREAFLRALLAAVRARRG